MDIVLALSVLVLLAAPLLARLVNRMPALKGGIDGFVLMTVLGLVTLTLLPESLERVGGWGLLVAFVGFILPWASEFLFHKTEEMTHRIVMLVATLALIIHAASDGALLAVAKDSVHGSFLATGVLLHRVGVAIAVWWLLRPVLTTIGGISVLAAMGAMTVVAYLMVIFAGEWYDVPLAGYWQAFAAGSLLHVVLHPIGDHVHAPKASTMTFHRIGTGLGILFVAGLIASHYYDHGPTVQAAGYHAHTMGHMFDYMASVGTLVAPIALLIMIGFAIYGKMNADLASAYRRLQQVAPWTLVLWFGVTLIDNIIPVTLPLPESVSVLFILWLGTLVPILVHTGARSFFAALLPRFILKHDHNH